LRTETEQRLHDALIACNDLIDLASGRNQEWCLNERIARLATERLLEIIGEALSAALRLTPDLEARLPQARKAIGLRNRIIHVYDKLNNTIIWSIVRDNIPPLANELKRLLNEETIA
jgi:uncharacterized protein with HEPN domain